MASPTPQQSKLLQIAPEIRKIVYGHLFNKVRREVHLYYCCDKLKIEPSLPTQLLIACRQLYLEASSMLRESLSDARLVVDHCGNTPHKYRRVWKTVQQDIFLEKCGAQITEAEIVEHYANHHSVRNLLNRHCPNLKKLIILCGWQMQLWEPGNKNDEWWLESPWVAEAAWDHWKSRTIYKGDSILSALTRTKKGVDRAYNVELIAYFGVNLTSPPISRFLVGHTLILGGVVADNQA